MAEFAQRGWFRLASLLLFGGIAALLFAVSDPVQAGAVLFVVPIAMLALSDGLRGGLTGAAAASILTAVWATADDIDLEVLGWTSRLVAFVVIGVFVGHFEDVARRHVRRGLDEDYATELHDRVVQSLVLARYALEERGEANQHVDDALANAKAIISERMAEVEPGDLRLAPRP